MNVLHTHVRCYRFHMPNLMQIRKLNNRVGKLPSSPLIGHPAGIDINDLDAHKNNKFAEVYKSAQEALGKDFHLRLKDTAYRYLANSEKNAIVRELLESTKKEIERAIDVIDSINEASEPKRDFIQIGLKSIVNQLHALAKQYEELQKEKE